MRRYILILLGIVGLGISGCNSGGGSNVATKSNPKSNSGTPTAAPTGSSPYFPGTSSKYKSIAAMNDLPRANATASGYDFVEVGASGSAFAEYAVIDQAGIFLKDGAWKTLTLPNGATGDFKQVVACASDGNGSGGTNAFVAVGDQGMAYVFIAKYSSNSASSTWTVKPINSVNHTMSLVGATCLKSNDPNNPGATFILVGNRPGGGSDGSSQPVFLEGSLTFVNGDYMVGAPVLHPITAAEAGWNIETVASDNMTNIVIAGNKGLFFTSSNSGQSWNGARIPSVPNEVLSSLIYLPPRFSDLQNAAFIFAGSTLYGKILPSNTPQGAFMFKAYPLNTPVKGGDGINSIACGFYDCLFSAVNSGNNPSQQKNYLLQTNLVLISMINRIVTQDHIIGELYVPNIGISQLIFVGVDPTLSGYFALYNNEIYAYKPNKDRWGGAVWRKIGDLPQVP